MNHFLSFMPYNINQCQLGFKQYAYFSNTAIIQTNLCSVIQPVAAQIQCLLRMTSESVEFVILSTLVSSTPFLCVQIQRNSNLHSPH